MRPVDEHIKLQLTQRLDLIGEALDADVVVVVSPIVPSLGELYQFEQARELSVELLINWLSRYKFKIGHEQKPVARWSPSR